MLTAAEALELNSDVFEKTLFRDMDFIVRQRARLGYKDAPIPVKYVSTVGAKYRLKINHEEIEAKFRKLGYRMSVFGTDGLALYW